MPTRERTKEIKSYHFIMDRMEEDGCFTGYASVFHTVDQQMDVVLPGAFAQCNPKRVKLLWQHDYNEPIGKILSLREDERGLLVTAKLLLSIRRGLEAYHLLKNDAIQGLSIGYSTIDYSMSKNNTVRLLKELNLWEISLVTFPANHDSIITGIKAGYGMNVEALSNMARELDKIIGNFRECERARSTHDHT